MYNNFSVPHPEIMGNYRVTIFWFPENSWEPTFYFISFNVQKQFSGNIAKHALKLKNISVYYYLQKTSMSIIKMSEQGQFIC